MNRLLCFKVLLGCVAAMVLLQGGYLMADAQETPSATSEDLGRDNPFEKVNKPQKHSITRRIFDAEGQLAEDVPELYVQTVMLKFLDAKSLTPALENMLSAYGVITIDKKSNSIIVSDTRANLDKIIGEIKKADKTPQQIVIEVVILDVQLDDDTQIGVNWDILSDGLLDISYRQNFTSRLGSTIENATNTGNASAFNTTGTGGDFALISGTIRNIVHLLQEKKDVEILASPHVLLVSGSSAMIETVEEIPYREQTQTGAGGVLASTEFKEVGIKLKVSALVTDDNDILLTVEPEQNVNTGVFGIDDIPIIDTRKARTTLMLKDGEIVVMGGLRRKEETRIQDKIPILGDLPLIGILFKKDNVRIKHSELIVFLSPHIYRGNELSDEEMSKFNELRDRPLLKIPKLPTPKEMLLGEAKE